MRFRDRLARAMYGRYGNDALNRFILVIVLILLVLSYVFRIRIINSVGLVLLILTYVRMFSKNITKRYNENMKYLQIRNQFLGWFRIKKLHLSQQKDYHFFKCPGCGQKVRVPRGKGKIEITCPKCRLAFIKRS